MANTFLTTYNNDLAFLPSSVNTIRVLSLNAITTLGPVYTLDDQFAIIEANVELNPVTIQLTSMSGAPNQSIYIRRLDELGTGNLVTVLPQAGYTIFGVSSVTLGPNVQVVNIYSDPVQLDWKTLANSFDELAPVGVKGSMIARTNSTYTSVPVGPDGYVLTANSGAAPGIFWAAPGSGSLGLLWTRERITATASGPAVSPSLTVTLTFISTTGSGVASGTLANGTIANDGQEKILVATSLTCPYSLVVTSFVTAEGTAGTRTLRFDATGRSATLLWSNLNTAWFIKGTGVTII